MSRTGLVEFKQVLADFHQLSSLAVKGVVAIPLLDIWLNLGPPPVKAVAGLASLMEFIAVVSVFQFGFGSEERRLRVWMKVALTVFVVCLVCSLALLERFTVLPGQGRDRVMEGFALRADVEPIINGSYTAEEALRESEFDPHKVWTSWSIAILRTFITAIWLATFASLAVYLAVFVILRRHPHPVALPAAMTH